jgi:hypothetical protein
MTESTPQLPPVKLAFIIDGVVQDVLHTDDRLAAIFLSEPTIVDVTELLSTNTETTLVGKSYVDGNFVTPEA